MLNHSFMMKKTVAVLITAYNRKSITLNGLRSLWPAMEQCQDTYEFDVYLADDNSTDGTAGAVSEVFPQIKIIKGDGNLYWGGGMNLAWREALQKREYDYYLWMNDDAKLYPDSIAHLLSVEKDAGEPVLVCGVFEDSSGHISYGACDRSGKLLEPRSLEHPYYMNGNLVLVPKQIYESIGIIDSVFHHRGGDYDYGLRAQKAGFKLFISDIIVGITPRHDTDKTPYYSAKHTLSKRLKLLYSKKYSIISSFIYNKRHVGMYFAIHQFLKAHALVLFPVIRKSKHSLS